MISLLDLSDPELKDTANLTLITGKIKESDLPPILLLFSLTDVMHCTSTGDTW